MGGATGNLLLGTGFRASAFAVRSTWRQRQWLCEGRPGLLRCAAWSLREGGRGTVRGEGSDVISHPALSSRWATAGLTCSTQPRCSASRRPTQQKPPPLCTRDPTPGERERGSRPLPCDSITQCSFRGCREALPTEARRLGHEQVGRSELSGFSENNQPSVPGHERDPAHFSTSYQWRWGQALD